MIRLGAIADDLTGATDLAITLTAAGFRSAVVVGHEAVTTELGEQADAVVVALKSRTSPVDQAVSASLAALDALQRIGAERFYFKYCSTFDSTPEGNIGPVTEALLDALDEDATVVCPSFPANGRTVYQGHLFVGSQPLDESPMRHHPLTPMTDSNLVRLMAAQTRATVGLVPLQEVHRGSSALREVLMSRARDGVRHLVVDAVTDDDLRTVAEAAGHLKLLTGGSGLAQGLDGPRARAQEPITVRDRRRVVLSGSASSMTQTQVRHGLEEGDGVQLDPSALRADLAGCVGGIVARALAGPATPFVVYATAAPSDVRNLDDAPLIEEALGAIAHDLVDRGVDSLVVAGGETSGAVVSALDITDLRLGPTLSPGVAWARAARRSGDDVMVVLKSGNFGGADLFTTAWDGVA
ncbi:3-oxo-tetronate kinase [Georgenia subflava]|uniref:3-oxo-tetronate kinase n=1 Tax=Georgenia subflava TaxID=1622177 RepID=A0A6N7EJB7_9MICO|nr:3-oxo-tetronate kinase [Georgenia subflava]MPV36286.1 four-carbon acid sugar kinase family protein [Georgenia subflava]